MILGGHRTVAALVVGAVLAVAGCSSAGSAGDTSTSSGAGPKVRPILRVRPVLLERRPTYASPTPLPLPSASTRPTDSSDLAWATPQLVAALQSIDCSQVLATPSASADDAGSAVVDCRGADAIGAEAYLLGPSALDESDVVDAKAEQAPGDAVGLWMVTLTLSEAGRAKLADASGQVSVLPDPRNTLAIVVDGQIASLTFVMMVIPDGVLHITGQLLEGHARELAGRFRP